MTELDTLFGIEFTILHARIHNFCTRLAFRRWESHWIHLLLESSSNTSYISNEEEYSLQMILAYSSTEQARFLLTSSLPSFPPFTSSSVVVRPNAAFACLKSPGHVSPLSLFPPSASSPSSPPSFVFVSLSNALLLPFLVAGTSSGHREAPPRHTQIHHDRTESQLIPGGHPHSGGKSVSRVSLISERARCIRFIRSLLNQILFLLRGH